MADMRAVNSSTNMMEELESTDKQLHVYSAGIETKLDYLAQIASSDYVIVVAEAEVGSSAAAVAAAIASPAEKFTRTVNVALKNSAGVVMGWFTGALPVSVAENTVGDGVAALTDGITSISFVAGEASFTVDYTGTWAADDTCTVTVGNASSINGVSVANKTSVDTLVA